MFIKNCNLCCSQLTPTTSSIGQKTRITFKVYHKVNCKSKCDNYLMECTLCNKQCVGNADTALNFRLNNH